MPIVWTSNNVTPDATYKVPVDTGASGNPSHITLDQVASWVGASQNKFVQGIVADDGSSGSVATANRTALQAALDVGGHVRIQGTGTLWIDTTLIVKSNTFLEIDPWFTIKNRAGVNAPVLKNYNYSAASLAAGDSHIYIHGGIFDGNKANQTVAFTTVDIRRVSNFIFDKCHFNNGLRTGAYHLSTASSNGEGIVMRYSQYGTVRDCFASYNAYDGFKVRGSTDITLMNIKGLDNGKGLLQISHDPTDATAVGSPSRRIKMIGGECVHTTGVPDLSAPTTVGVYLHGAVDCTIIGLSVDGTRQGIGGVEHMARNVCDDLNLRTRFATDLDGVSRAVIETENAFNGGFVGNNSFTNVKITPLSGANGKYIALQGDENAVRNVQAVLGSGTGTWTATTSGNNNKVTDARLEDVSTSGFGANGNTIETTT